MNRNSPIEPYLLIYSCDDIGYRFILIAGHQSYISDFLNTCDFSSHRVKLVTYLSHSLLHSSPHFCYVLVFNRQQLTAICQNWVGDDCCGRCAITRFFVSSLSSINKQFGTYVLKLVLEKLNILSDCHSVFGYDWLWVKRKSWNFSWRPWIDCNISPTRSKCALNSFAKKICSLKNLPSGFVSLDNFGWKTKASW